MKNVRKASALALLATTALLGSCNKDFLDRPPQGQLVTDNFYQTASDLRIATAGLYGRPWFDFNWPFNLDIGEAMSGNSYSGNSPRSAYINFSVPDGEAGLQYGWSALYNVIAQSNTVVNNVARVTPASVPASARNAAIGEARLLRGLAYFYLVRLWGPVPIVSDNSTLVQQPLLPRIVVSDVYRFIIEDLKFAADNLPTSDTPGRATAWTAKGLLAKVYLTKAGVGQSGTRNQADLDQAKLYAGQVATTSGLTLLPSYYDVFLRKNRNSPESLLSIQWVANQGWGGQNVLQAYLAPDSKVAGVGDGWNNVNPSADLYSAYETADVVRRKATFMLNGDVYPELTTKDNPNGYTMTAIGPAFKKYVIGGPTAPGNDGQVSVLNTDINTFLLRLSDVYLTYAEATLGNSATTTNADALLYYNKVRTRAGLPAETVLDATKILHERRVEFALEGQYWFDILRLHDYNPAAADALIAAQHRNGFTYSPTAAVRVTETPRFVTPSARSYVLPLPAADVVANPKLQEAPVGYY